MPAQTRTNKKRKEKALLPINGMTCASCAATITKGLNKVHGVSKVNVNVASETASVEYDPDKVDHETLMSAVSDAGYEVAVEKTTFGLGGMTCASCVASNEKALMKVPGVISANVNLATEKATVTYLRDEAGMADFKRAVESAGYSITDFKDEEKVDEDIKKVRKAKRLLVYALIPEAIVMLLMLLHYMIPGVTIPGYNYIIALLGFPIVFVFGWATHRASWKAIRHGKANMDVLISLGSIPPYLMGFAVFIFPAAAFMEMATTIVTFHLLGRFLETRAKGRASQAIKKLVQLGAKTARVIVNGAEKEIPIEEVKVGDVMVVRPGEKIPTDGVIVEGRSAIDESMATGE